MNTKGHHAISEVGVTIIREALAAAGRGKPRLGAFYLGNWLTDVSQTVDPIAFPTLADKLKGEFGNLFQAIHPHVDSTIDALTGVDHGLRHAARKIVDWSDPFNLLHDRGSQTEPHTFAHLRQNIHHALSDLQIQLNAAADIALTEQLPAAMKNAMRVAGYFKFAHPVTQPHSEDEKGGKFIDFDAYLKVFEQRFTQYYPHEHMDRPEDFTKRSRSGPVYRSERNTALGISEYMHEDIEVAAGSISHLDLEWASKQFRPGAPVNDRDEDFNLHLAELGHAMHLIEDFFAHSNFVEHAARSLGPEWLDWTKLAVEDRDIFTRRLSAVERPGWENPGMISDEPMVVTGYFDSCDTAVSLSHALEEIIGEQEWLESLGEHMAKKGNKHIAGEIVKHVPDFAKGTPDKSLSRTAKDAENAVEEFFRALKDPTKSCEQYTKLLHQTLELWSDPEAALSDPENAVAAKLKNEVEKYVYQDIPPEVSRKLLKDLNVPRIIQDNFVQFVSDFSVARHQVVAGVKVGINLYKAIKYLVMFLNDPAEVIEKEIRKVVGKFIADHITDRIIESIAYYAKRVMYEKDGGRIGCHSLMAKDYGEEALAEYSTACAKALHGYVIKSFVRRSEKKQLQIRRKPISGDQGDRRNTSDSQDWIDWKELLFFHLRHPTLGGAVREELTVGEPLLHITCAGETVDSIVKQFRNTAVFPWQFDTDHVLAANPYLAPYCGSAGDYTIPQGTFVIIPDQKGKWRIPDPHPINRAWWRPILETGKYETMERQDIWDDKRSGRCVPINYHVWHGVKRAVVEDTAKDGNKLREELERRYQKVWCTAT